MAVKCKIDSKSVSIVRAYTVFAQIMEVGKVPILLSPFFFLAASSEDPPGMIRKKYQASTRI